MLITQAVQTGFILVASPTAADHEDVDEGGEGGKGRDTTDYTTGYDANLGFGFLGWGGLLAVARMIGGEDRETRGDAVEAGVFDGVLKGWIEF